MDAGSADIAIYTWIADQIIDRVSKPEEISSSLHPHVRFKCTKNTRLHLRLLLLKCQKESCALITPKKFNVVAIRQYHNILITQIHDCKK